MKNRSPRVYTDRKPEAGQRILQRKRVMSPNVLQVGLRRPGLRDFYHRVLTIGWLRFFVVSALIFLLANVVFGLLYFLQPGSISGARLGSFADAFFFSVETFSTLGYGVLSPATLYANWVMTAECLFGLMTVAMLTGLLFARVSRPTALVLFAHHAVIAQHDGKPTLMIRMGNERRSQIVEANVGLSLLRSEYTREGRYLRRFYDLKLERPRTPVFALSFTLMHVIDEQSPLFGLDHAAIVEAEMELLLTVSGLDEWMGQLVHARTSYDAGDIRFGHRYVDIFGVTEDGRRAIDYRRFHDVEPETIAEQSKIAS